jgi:hypothetical protein
VTRGPGTWEQLRRLPPGPGDPWALLAVVAVLVVAAALAAEREWSAAVALTVGLMVGFASGAVVAWGLWGRR